MKTPIRLTGAVLLLAATGTALWWLWNGGSLRESPTTTAAAPTSGQVAIPAWTPPPFSGTANRTVPDHTPVTQLPEIPAQPTDREIMQSRAYARRLAALEGKRPPAEDNAALGELLRRVRGLDEDAKLEETEKWLAAHPDSRWSWSLRAEVATMRYERGWFAQARDGYQSLWNELRTREDVEARGLADEALDFLLENDLGTGRAARLKELLAQADGRARTGNLESQLLRAQQAVYLLEHVGAQSVRCGPLALNAIQKHTTGKVTPVSLNNVPASFIATGIPLSEVQKYAVDHYKLPLMAARRTDAAAEIPVPAVLHGDDHYVALTAAEPGRYFLVDRAREFAGWVSAAAVDALSSGNFLVPQAEKPAAGFALLADNDARNVFGRDGAHGTGPGDESSNGGNNNQGGGDKKGPCGMPRYTFNLQLAGLILNDIPLRYPTPAGPEMEVGLTFQEMDSSQPAATPAYPNTGLVWVPGLTGFVEHVTGTLTASSKLRIHERKGGVDVLDYDTEQGIFGPGDVSFSTVTKSGTSYLRTLPDGSTETYSTVDVPAAPARIFLTSFADPAGNTVTFTYDAFLRLTAITDPFGQVMTLQYAHPTDPWRITSITDPFSRTCVLGYDATDRLTAVTDQIGLTSTFTYLASGFLSSMTTPYGTTQFRKISETAGTQRIIEVEDPQGDIERVQFADPGTAIDSLPPARQVTVGGQTVPIYVEYGRLQFRNSYYWSKEAWHAAPNDYSAAMNYRWFTDVNWLVLPVLEAIKPALEQRTWFSYPGQETSAGEWTPYYSGMGVQPSMALLMVDAQTAQLTQSHRNRLGKIIKQVDALGRTTEFTYAANGSDVTEIRQTTSGVSERIAAMTYTPQRKIATFTDAAGQTTTMTYNARGQILTITDALGGVITYTYNATGGLISLDGPLPGAADTWTLTRDPLNRASTITDQDGYTISLLWDDFDRLTRRTHPDGTYEEWTYNRLDLASYRDRMGRISTLTHNALQQTTSFTDPLGRVTAFEWCRCGDMKSVTDPLGRRTQWVYDVQGRLKEKILPDGGRIRFQHHPATGWLTSRTDEKGQTVVFDHYLDGLKKSVAYPNAQVPTPSVQMTYEPVFGRLSTLTDGEGTTAFTYHPITGGASPGAGQLASVDGPWNNDTVTLTWNALGLPAERSINGVPATYGYDAAGRRTSVTNALGAFTFTYDGGSQRLASEQRPGGGQSLYTYFGGTNTRRLQTLRHEAPGGGLISEFGHTWDATGRLTGWTQQRGAAAVENWTLTQDAAAQLTGATVVQAGSPNRTFAYEYDAAGNRMAEVLDGVRSESSFNVLNQLTHSGGTLPAASYEWDAEDRLTAIVRGTRRTEFTYDGRGHRVRQVEKNGATVESDVRFLWCGNELCEERSADGSTVLRRFFAEGEQTVAGGAVSFYTRDHLQSVREQVNAAGAATLVAHYDPWGRITSGSSPAFGFTGVPLHGPSGLHLALFRAYDPGSGRWLSRDPMGEQYGWNLYQYAGNAPGWRTDRTGLWAGVDDAIAAGAGAIVGVGGQLISDAVKGEMSGWEDYAGSAVGGAVGGLGTLYGGPVAGGLAGGATGNLVKQGLKNLTGKQDCFSPEQFAFDTAAGGLGGWVGGANIGAVAGEGAEWGTKLGAEVANGMISAGTPFGVGTGMISDAISEPYQHK